MALSKAAAVQQVVAALIPAQSGIASADLSDVLAIAGKLLSDKSPDARTLVANIQAGTSVSPEQLQKYAGKTDLGPKPILRAEDVGATLGNGDKGSAVKTADEAVDVKTAAEKLSKS